AYSAYYFATPGDSLRFTPDNLARVYVLMVAAPAMALMAGALRAHAMTALRREQDARQVAESISRDLVALRGALDQTKVGIVLLDRELCVQFVNSAFRRIWRVPDSLAESRPPFVRLMYHG